MTSLVTDLPLFEIPFELPPNIESRKGQIEGEDHIVLWDSESELHIDFPESHLSAETMKVCLTHLKEAAKYKASGGVFI